MPNSTAQYPTVTVVSQYAGGQTQTGKVFVPPATETFTHDADGNLTSDGRWTYSWDGENRLVQMIRDTDSPAGARQKLVFEYDHQDRRIRKQFFTSNNGWQEQTDTVYLYEGWNPAGELNANASNASVRTYVWGTDLSGTMQGAGGVGGLLKVRYFGGTTTNAFAAYDGNGNVMALVDASNGSVCARYDYGPFAEPVRISGPMGKVNPVRFSSKYTDDESGFLYYGYRYYNPSTGRWPNRDSIGEEGGVKLYGFVGNNAANTVDPYGLWFNDHDELTEREFYMALGTDPAWFRPCYKKIIKVVIAANIGQDHGSAKYDLKRHFNRPIDQPTGSQAATYIGAYTRYLADEENDFHTPLNMETPGRTECETALKALGRLMHSWQDYYAHAVVLTANGHTHTLWDCIASYRRQPGPPLRQFGHNCSEQLWGCQWW
ncbi:MAG: RHS repeat domain-containing protein [Verrucomicrobiia bacterium]